METTILERLDRALGRIDRPGTFCAIGSVAALLPGLEVEGVGPVGLPLTAAAAKDLIRHGQRAPHGQGEATVVDAKVRRVWRIEPGRFRLRNPEWDRLIEAIVGEVGEELGLDRQGLQAHLHDLLLYEKGDFFQPHRDGEKLARMVATLVIVLPSSHEGGELIVRHDGQERIADFGGPSADPFRIHYAAFYADCEHEVRPLKKGRRLCLIYNLTLARSDETPTAPRDSESIEAIEPILREWAADEGSAEKLGIPLDHQYTRDGLTWDALKGTDRVKARVLATAARVVGCRAYLALLTLHQSGDGEEVHGRYGYGRGRRYGRSDESEEKGDGGKYTMVELAESELTADHWSDPEGNRLPIGEMEVEEKEVLDPESLTRIQPEEVFQGYTGNEGSPLDRWYRHAAIFVWPESRHFEIVCSRDSRGVVPELVRMIERRDRAAVEERPAIEATCRELAAAIVARWPEPNPYRRPPEIEGDASPARLFIDCLERLDEPGRIASFLETALPRDVSADPGPSIVDVGRRFGWATFRPALASVMEATSIKTMERNVRLLETISTAGSGKEKGWKDLCANLAEQLIAAIEAMDRKPSTGFEWSGERIDRAAVLVGLARALIATGQSDLMSRFIDHARGTPKRYPMTEAHIQAIVDLRPWLTGNLKKPFPPLSRWIEAVRKHLEVFTEKEPREPEDFRRAAPISCDCAECTELKTFLKDSRERSHRFTVNEGLRNHIQLQIRHNTLDLDCRTEARGRPYTLVCTKNTASYQAALKKDHEDRAHLETIRAIEASLPG